jgi:hypothetical protein
MPKFYLYHGFCGTCGTVPGLAVMQVHFPTSQVSFLFRAVSAHTSEVVIKAHHEKSPGKCPSHGRPFIVTQHPRKGSSSSLHSFHSWRNTTTEGRGAWFVRRGFGPKPPWWSESPGRAVPGETAPCRLDSDGFAGSEYPAITITHHIERPPVRHAYWDPVPVPVIDTMTISQS